jgi:hypothetical protein
MKANIEDILVLEGRRTKAAIYAVENVTTGRRLIAATSNLSKRLYDQQHALELGVHFNPALNADLLVLGQQAFRLVVLELVDDVRALARTKRLHVEHARQTSGAYNAETPIRRKLLLDHNASKAIAEVRNKAAAKSVQD